MITTVTLKSLKETSLCKAYFIQQAEEEKKVKIEDFVLKNRMPGILYGSKKKFFL